MKKILAIFCILAFGGFIIVGCEKSGDEGGSDSQQEIAKQDDESSENLLIEPGVGVGAVKFGMTVDEMKGVLGKPDVAATGISFMYKSLGIEVVAKDKETVSAISCGNPHNINTPVVKALGTACKFKTAEGIGIGSTGDQILQAYGDPTKKSDERLLYKDEGIGFFLFDGKVIGIWLLK